MKNLKTLILLIAAVFLFSCGGKKNINQTFSFEPSNVVQNSSVTVYYKPDSTNLKDADSISMNAYLFGKELNETIEVKMTKEEGFWSANLSISDTSYGVIITFMNKDIIDNNKEKGYLIICVDENENQMPEAIAGLAVAQSQWGYYPNIEMDKESAKLNFDKAFSLKPDLINDFADSYFRVVSDVVKSDANIVIKQNLQKLESKKSKTEKDLETLANWFNKVGEIEKADHYSGLLSASFPKSEYFQRRDFTTIRAEIDFSKKIKLAEDFKSKYAKSEYTNSINSLLCNEYLKKDDYKSLLDFMTENKLKIDPYRFYSVANKILENNGDIKIVRKISELGIERAKNEVSNPSEKKPYYLSTNKWKEERKTVLGYNYFAFSKVLFAEKNFAEAIDMAEKSVTLTNEEDGEINELFITLLQKTNQNEKLIKSVEYFIVEGKSNSAMKNILKEVYPDANNFDKYLTSLNERAKEKMSKKLKSEMLDLKAEDFSLQNLEGKQVSLSSFKDKIVILDFWATWCGPCRDSFPGMKLSVEKYKQNSDVQFLFINTWENVPNKSKNAADFIKKNQYPFNVLLDIDNQVVSNYKVSGIPTKFIIDQDGKIRFKSIGYSGNTESLVDEISMMIELLKNK